MAAALPLKIRLRTQTRVQILATFVGFPQRRRPSVEACDSMAAVQIATANQKPKCGLKRPSPR